MVDPDKHHYEEGFVLVTALMMLVALSLLGLATIMTSTVELKIAANDRVHTETFYRADGGTEIGTVLAYENALCMNAGGFTEGTVPDQRDIGFLRVQNLSLAEPGQGTDTLPDDLTRDAVYSTVPGDDAQPHTNFTVNGVVENADGSGLQMISGYRGLGRSSAAGGAHIRYAVNSQRLGPRNSRSTVTLQWRMSGHLINSASSFDCKY